MNKENSISLSNIEKNNGGKFGNEKSFKITFPNNSNPKSIKKKIGSFEENIMNEIKLKRMSIVRKCCKNVK